MVMTFWCIRPCARFSQQIPIESTGCPVDGNCWKPLLLFFPHSTLNCAPGILRILLHNGGVYIQFSLSKGRRPTLIEAGGWCQRVIVQTSAIYGNGTEQVYFSWEKKKYLNDFIGGCWYFNICSSLRPPRPSLQLLAAVPVQPELRPS